MRLNNIELRQCQGAPLAAEWCNGPAQPGRTLASFRYLQAPRMKLGLDQNITISITLSARPMFYIEKLTVLEQACSFPSSGQGWPQLWRSRYYAHRQKHPVRLQILQQKTVPPHAPACSPSDVIPERAPLQEYGYLATSRPVYLATSRPETTKILPQNGQMLAFQTS